MSLRVLFRAPAGPRRGFGHLVRCRSLARALGVRPLIAIRGGQRARAAARALGCDVMDGVPAAVIARVAPHVVIVDDPIASDARRWIACARRFGCRVVTVHDLGLGAREGDLVVDGSIVKAAGRPKGLQPRSTNARSGRPWSTNARGCRPSGLPRQLLRGPRFALLDPVYASPLRAVRHPRAPRVLIALGGGPRVALGYAIARAVRREMPWASIRIAGGFAAASAADRHRIAWTGPLDGLARELDACDLAVVGGGVSLYEACARGVAAVGVPVVVPQRPTVRGFVTAGASLGDASGAPDADRVARDVVALLRRPALRRALAAQGRRLVDGRGASRVADAIRQLAVGRPEGLQPRSSGRPEGLQPRSLGRPEGLQPRSSGRPEGLQPRSSGRPEGLQPRTTRARSCRPSGLPVRRVS
jgi:UDP-2,4-diacetamido-2,4,6-trideoxy-beta-L-altropyranose hydrolase